MARVLGQAYGKINLAVVEKNCPDNYGRKKRLVRFFNKAQVMEMYCMYSIGSYLWQESIQDLG